MIDPLFSVPIGTYDNIMPNHLDEYEKACKHIMEVNGSGHPFYCNVQSTFDTVKRVHEYTEFEGLARTVSMFAQRFAKEIGSKQTTTIRHSWINIANSMDYQERHHHIARNTSFVGVYYVTSNKEDKLLLMKPYHDLSWMEGGSQYLRPEVEIECRPGRLVFFPSYVEHQFKSIERRVPKISIAFNITVG